MKRRNSCAVRDDEIRDRTSLTNNNGFLLPDITKNELQQQTFLNPQVTYPNHEDELQHRSSLDSVFEDDDYYLTSIASQRYSFLEYQGIEDPNQLPTILESPHPRNSSELNVPTIPREKDFNEDVVGVNENDTKNLGEEKTNGESLEFDEECGQPVECTERDDSKDNVQIMEDEKEVVDSTVQSPSLDHPISRNTEKKEEKCTKYKSNLNSKPIDLPKAVIPKMQLYRSPEIVNGQDSIGGVKIMTLQSKSELVRKDRERRHLIRLKMEAASVIQRWYRRCRGRKHTRQPENTIELEEAVKDQQELVQQLAALTIQLGWRKYLREKYKGASTEVRERPLNKVVHSDSLRSNDSANSNSSTIRRAKCRNMKSEVRRSTAVASAKRRSRMDSRAQTSHNAVGRSRKTALFSPNASSYNLALDMQNPVVAKRGNTRTSTPRRGANNKIRPSTTVRRTTSAWTR